MAKYKRISDAVYAWTSELTRIPQSVVEKLQKANCDDIMEITPPTVGNRVELFYAGQSGEITKRIQQTDKDVVHTDDGEDVTVKEGEFEVVRDDYLPMWGTMWAFNDPCDGWWLENNLDKMAECGFRIYESEDYDYIFGIDGCGYDFFSAHWQPLYKARGLHWHESED